LCQEKILGRVERVDLAQQRVDRLHVAELELMVERRRELVDVGLEEAQLARNATVGSSCA